MNFFTKTLTLFLFCTSMMVQAQEYRSMDGSSNNQEFGEWGATESPLEAFTKLMFSDGYSEPGGERRMNPRTISNVLVQTDRNFPNSHGLSDFIWALGQFLDHDLSLIEDDLTEPMSIRVPAGDSKFDPTAQGGVFIKMFRSLRMEGTGTDLTNPRQFGNAITHWIDASNVYGSDEERAHWLRSFEDGKLKTSAGNFLPFNTTTGELDAEIDETAPHMFNENPRVTKFFVAGDVRANENIVLISMHTLFVREHNRLCDELRAVHPDWDDDQLYENARMRVIGIMQAIIYEEWLPLLGVELEPYSGYNEGMNPAIMNTFSAAAYRLGHTLLSSNLMRLDENRQPIPEGNILLRDAFFDPARFYEDGGIEPILRGAAHQRHQEFDVHVVEDVRSFLFGRPGEGGLDLAAINIARGRERGLMDYNSVRKAFGLPKHLGFHQITDNLLVSTKLRKLYGNINKIDPWIGMLSEGTREEGLLGETMATILAKQFQHLRDGDRFYYENDEMMSDEAKAEIKQTRLSDVILRNTEIETLQSNAFIATETTELAAIAPPPPVATGDMKVSPNPSFGEVNLRLNMEVSGPATMQISDLSGRIMKTRKFDLYSGINNINLHLDYPAGIYHVIVQQDQKIQRTKLVLTD